MIDAAQEKLSRFVWENRYRHESESALERSIEDTWRRVATAAAAVEREPGAWAPRFLDILRDYRFLPGGRILAGAGTVRQVTLCNCFVMGSIDDSIEGIFESLKEGALTMQQGGGIGYDFSTLRPRGWPAPTTGAVASGPVSFMRIWDATCATILSTGPRRGAMMAALRCGHPDIEEFIEAARTPGALSHFNLSVLITDAFMEAVRADEEWPLAFCGRVARSIRARELWHRLCTSADQWAEPGVLFIDRINQDNNLGFCETLSVTSACGEVPLPPYGACPLGAVNLPRFVRDEFGPAARIDHAALDELVGHAVRFLDDVLEISRFPLFRQRRQAHDSRRIGLGITGLGDALAMLKVRYDSQEGRTLAENIVTRIRDAAYSASVALAKEKGAFPACDAGKLAGQPFIRRLPEELRAAIQRYGIRNSHLLALPPCNTISLLAGNVSNGVEPIFGLQCFRRVRDAQGEYQSFQVPDPAYAAWRTTAPPGADLPGYFAHGSSISPSDHLLMQATLQPLIDNAISKSVPLDAGTKPSDVPPLLEAAYDLGLKGCTLFRPEARASALVRGGPLAADGDLLADEQACTVNRASD